MTPRNTAYLTDIYVAAGRYDDALATAKKAIEMNPRAGVAWQALGFVHSAMGHHDEAIDANRRAAEYAPPYGRTIAEFPLTAGVVGVVLAPVVAALGTMVALLQNCTIHVERVRAQPGETSEATASE
jgi:tetratricopeptide (TPR) repeat protein